MKKKTKENIFKRWYKLAQPHKGYFAAEIIFSILYYLFLSVITIFAAKTINCMYEGNWTGAFIFLGIELITIILRSLINHFAYRVYALQVQHVRLLVANKIYKKLLSSEKKAINEVSKEKIINISLNNMDYLSDFPDSISLFIGKLFLVIFTVVVVFINNIYAGLIVLGMGVINFFAYYQFNKKLGRVMLERHEKRDDMYKTYSKVIEGKSVIRELNASENYGKELLGNVKKFTRAYSKYYVLYSYKNDIYYIAWNAVVYAIAALMLFFVSKGTLGIESYLIIVPYLTTTTEGLNYLFDKTSAVENMRVDVDRINLILGMSDKELISYGNLNKQAEGYALGFVDVSKKKKKGQTYSLKNVNITFKTGEINVVKGPKENGKRVIFDILRRFEKPDKGKVLLDNLDLFAYNESTFKSHINYCASRPEFIRGTIKENLMLANKDIKKIEVICKELGVLDEINALPKKFGSQIEDVKSLTTRFMMGLVRALLSDCKILMVYELPDEVPNLYRKNIERLISNHNLDKTIILFTHSNVYDKAAKCVYSVVKGQVKKIK